MPMRVGFVVAAVALLHLVFALLLGGCGSSAVPLAFMGAWAVVMRDAQGWPQEDFVFDIFSDGSAWTAARKVGTCDTAGVLTMSFSGWEGGDVTAAINLRTDGTGTGTWQRTVITPASGTATCTRASATEHVGTYQLVYDGNAATASTIQVSREGLVIVGGLGIGVVGEGGSFVMAIRTSAETGAVPLVLTGTMTPDGASGTYALSTGETGTWVATKT